MIRPPPSSPLFPYTPLSRSFVSSGERRQYLLYVPKSYDRRVATPLVISLHAAALWGAAQKETSQWNRVADRDGFIVVYPSGVDRKSTRLNSSHLVISYAVFC